MLTQVVSSRNTGCMCSYEFKLASGERILVSITRHPRPSIKLVRLAPFGVIPFDTLWEYSPTMAQEPGEFLDVIGECLFERSSSIDEIRLALAEYEGGGRPRHPFVQWPHGPTDPVR